MPENCTLLAVLNTVRSYISVIKWLCLSIPSVGNGKQIGILNCIKGNTENRTLRMYVD